MNKVKSLEQEKKYFKTKFRELRELIRDYRDEEGNPHPLSKHPLVDTPMERCVISYENITWDEKELCSFNPICICPCC